MLAEAESMSDDQALVIYGSLLLSAGVCLFQCYFSLYFPILNYNTKNVMTVQKPEDALKLLHNTRTLEAFAVSIHALLAMDRPDLAV